MSTASAERELGVTGGTGRTAIAAPWTFGYLVQSKSVDEVTTYAFVIGGVIMAIGGIVEILLGVEAARKPLEAVARPLNAVRGRRHRAAMPANAR